MVGEPAPGRGRARSRVARTHESAAWADSCITSPSWPVTCSSPLPGYAVASMKRTSPPTAVHGEARSRRPDRTVRLRDSPEKRRGPSHSRTRVVVDRDLLGLAPRRPASPPCGRGRRSAARGCARPASRVYSRMTSRSASSVSSSLLRLEPVRLELLREQVALRDLELLVLGVARELDHVHAVEQRPRDRVQLVRGADEQHLREVEREVEVVVAEGRCSARGRAPRASRSAGSPR